MKPITYIAFAVSVLLILALVITGCDIFTAVANDKVRKARKMLEDATVLERANKDLVQKKQKRNDLEKDAQRFRVDAEVGYRQIQRIKEEQEKLQKAFVTVQDAAKAAGLPHKDKATPEDKMKQIRVGTKTISGSEVYHSLQEYKDGIQKAQTAVEREQTKSTLWVNMAEKIESALVKIEAVIDEMEVKIEDFKMWRKIFEATKDIEIGESDLENILNTESTIGELNKRIDGYTIGVGDVGDTTPEEIKDDISNPKPKNSITDDDLI